MGDAFVTIFEREDKLILAPSGRSPAGLRVPIEPVLVVPKADTPGLVSRLGEALTASESAKVPTPDWKTFRPPNFAAVGAKDERQFFKGVRTCTVHRQPGKGFVITPLRLADSDNLVPDTDSAILLEEAGLDRVAEAVKSALQISEQHP